MPEKERRKLFDLSRSLNAPAEITVDAEPPRRSGPWLSAISVGLAVGLIALAYALLANS